MVTGVSTDAGAVFVITVDQSELTLGVHEQHFTRMQPAALQVDTKGRGVFLLNRTGKNHRFTLMFLQELNVTEYLTETKINVLQTALQGVRNLLKNAGIYLKDIASRNILQKCAVIEGN